MNERNRVYHFSKLSSTNEYAKSLIQKANNPQELEWTLIIADEQEKGKGRYGNTWYSPEGGLWLSVILSPNNYAFLTLASGIAICEAIEELKVKSEIKWPNDILINDKKIAGILTELEKETVILGIGMNININNFPSEIKKYATSLLLETGRKYNKDIILKLILKKLKEKYELLKTNKLEKLLPLFRSYSSMFGKKVIIEVPNRIIEGKAIDVDTEGALLLELPSGRIEKVCAGKCRIIE